MSSFSTPAPKSKKKGHVTPYKTPLAANMNGAKAVDLVRVLCLFILLVDASHFTYCCFSSNKFCVCIPKPKLTNSSYL